MTRVSAEGAGRALDDVAARVLAPVDVARAALLRALVGTLRGFFADRDARTLALAVFAMLSAAALTGAAPLWLLALGPVVLGVPHLLADVRYLVARPGLHRRARVWLFVGVPLAITWAYPHAWVGLFAALGAIGLARGTWAKKGALTLAWGLVFVASLRHAHLADVVMAHAHNVVALVLFAILAAGRLRRGTATLVVVGVAALTAAVFGGALDDLFVRAHGYEARATGLDLDQLVRTLSPVSDPVRGVRWVLFFAFAQSVHYAIWLRLVPEAAREKPGVRPFAASYRALVRDVGRPAVLVTAALTAAAIAVALVDLRTSRDAYLRVAVFHAHLELAALVFVVVEGRRALAATRSSC